MPRRTEQLEKLQRDTFDLLVIGGGATGAGIALDASLRGLSVALIESDDFAAGSSSRSTKLIHGGVRYLQNVFTRLDWRQYSLVRSSLQERGHLLKSFPNLVHPLPILIPCYSYFEALYYRIGLKLYDWLAQDKTLPPSHYVSAKEASRLLPLVKKKGLKGAVIYYDGQFNDARLNMAIVLSAAAQGAVVANHLRLEGFVKKEGKIISAAVKDVLTQETWQIKARSFVNAAGPHADEVRRLDNPMATSLLQQSLGAHIVFNQKVPVAQYGLLIPKTADGRVMFLLPWQGRWLAGTTERVIHATQAPPASSEDVQDILQQLNGYLDSEMTTKDITAAWTGIRPLVVGKREENTADLSRDHMIESASSGLYSIVGGKWTTYRKMAQDLLDTMVAEGAIKSAKECTTEKVPLIYSSQENEEVFYTRLQHIFSCDQEIAKHLFETYGAKALDIAHLAAKEGLGARLVEGYPYILAEVCWAIRMEYACNPIDFLARRSRFAVLDYKIAYSLLPAVVDFFAKEWGWDGKRHLNEMEKAQQNLLDYTQVDSKIGVWTEAKTPAIQ